MRITITAFASATAVFVSACGSGTPTSPSALSPSPGLAVTVPRDDAPAPAPAPLPAPEPVPEPPAAPVPVPLIVNIVGSIGTFAFAPNPLTAVVGDVLVWINDDVRAHHIVLDDGTDLGLLMPGESTLPVALTAESTGYSCVFHPSMVGSINQPLPDEGDGDPYPSPYPDYGGRRQRDAARRDR
jgi:plastocyanin